jgi:hypothetical protein
MLNEFFFEFPEKMTHTQKVIDIATTIGLITVVSYFVMSISFEVMHLDYPFRIFSVPHSKIKNLLRIGQGPGFQIRLDKLNYEIGETVRGIVIHQGRSFDPKRFKFVVHGDEKTNLEDWSYKVCSLVLRYIDPYNDIGLRNSNTFFSEDLSSFLNGLGPSGSLERHELENRIQFYFTLPNTILESYKGENVEISYEISLTEERDQRPDTKKQVFFTVTGSDKKYTHSGNVVNEKRSIDGIEICFHRYNTFSPGEIIKGKIVNDMSKIRNLRKCELTLNGVENTIGYTRANEMEKNSVKESYKQEIIFNSIDQQINHQFEIKIPDNAKRTYEGKYSKYFWEIEAKFDIPSAIDKSINLQIPVV